MATSIITPEDLAQFKIELILEFKSIIDDSQSNQPKPKQEIEWLKSHQVQRLLKISPGTLHTLRINGTLPYSKVGGTIFYDKLDIETVLANNKRNSLFND
jgi:hypothetical protein